MKIILSTLVFSSLLTVSKALSSPEIISLTGEKRCISTKIWLRSVGLKRQRPTAYTTEPEAGHSQFVTRNSQIVNPHWGFYAHQRINRLAIFTLPAEMMPFYKKHLPYLMATSTNPDQRRYAVPDEAPRHFIDLEAYGDSVWTKPFWKEAVAFYGEDTLKKHGIAPWHIQRMRFQLTEAFREKDARRILKLSAELGHYVADANVPLHTTRNYNGQFTNQQGIHGFWESRLPELYATQYDFFVGTAEFLEKPHERIWGAVRQAHACLDSVLSFERSATTELGEGRKYGIEERNGQNVKVYSQEFSARYHALLNRQVERQMRAAIDLIGDLWFTCWVEAGQPDLTPLLTFKFSDEDKKAEETEQKSWLKRLFSARPEE